MGGEQDHGDRSIDALLDELAALRDLDRLRQGFPIDSEAHAVAAEQIERRSRALMDRFRGLQPALPEPEPEHARPPRPNVPPRRRQQRPRPPLTRVGPGSRRRGASPA